MATSAISDRLGFAEARFAPDWSGAPVPDCMLGRLVAGEVAALRARDLFAGVRAVVLGVPGAFTPVCTTRHVPEFIANAPALRAIGYERLVCIAPNDPWTVQCWANLVDPGGRVQFVSDGNLAFARALGLATRVEASFLGDCAQRYLMTVENGRIARLKVERDVGDLACTLTSTLLVD